MLNTSLQLCSCLAPARPLIGMHPRGKCNVQVDYEVVEVMLWMRCPSAYCFGMILPSISPSYKCKTNSRILAAEHHNPHVGRMCNQAAQGVEVPVYHKHFEAGPFA